MKNIMKHIPFFGDEESETSKTDIIDKVGFSVLIVTVILSALFGAGVFSGSKYNSESNNSCSGSSCSSENSNYSKHNYEECTKSELSMSSEIAPYFESFVEECKSRDVNYDHAFCLDWIHLMRSYGTQGVTDFSGTIEINEELVDDTTGMRFVVYHELGHWLGLEHSNGIMKRNYNSRDTEWARENWEELLDNYFYELKKYN